MLQQLQRGAKNHDDSPRFPPFLYNTTFEKSKQKQKQISLPVVWLMIQVAYLLVCWLFVVQEQVQAGVHQEQSWTNQEARTP